MALTSGERCQTLHGLYIDHMTVAPSYCSFEIKQLLKTSKPNNHFGQLKLITYAPDENLCAVTCLKEYLKRTELLRSGCKSLLVCYAKPHYKVSTNTISRWLNEVLKLSGKDTSISLQNITSDLQPHQQQNHVMFQMIRSWPWDGKIQKHSESFMTNL